MDIQNDIQMYTTGSNECKLSHHAETGRLFSNFRLTVVSFSRGDCRTENSFSKLIRQSVRHPHIILSRGIQPRSHVKR
jgi:hypothetical protein